MREPLSPKQLICNQFQFLCLDLLKQSGLMQRLPTGVRAMDDLIYSGIDSPDCEATLRRKPRGKPVCPTTLPSSNDTGGAMSEVLQVCLIFLCCSFKLILTDLRTFRT